MSLLPNIPAEATITSLQNTGSANANGATLDLQGYKGPVTFLCAVGQSSHGVGSLDSANIQTSATDTAGAFTDVSGGAFTAVTNTANASNIGIQAKAFDVRQLSRYVRVPTVISGTNANIPLAIVAIGQKERV